MTDRQIRKLRERFNRKVHRGVRRQRGDEVWYCDEWIKEPKGEPNGRGRTKVNGRFVYATWVAWFLRYEQWPPILYGKVQMNHRCDNPACVNPEHIYLGTPQHNADDQCRSQPPIPEPAPRQPSERRVAARLRYFQRHQQLPQW